MKAIKIEIEPPTTEHCMECDYKGSNSFDEYPVRCPNCGKSSMSMYYFHPKAIYVDRREGSFYWNRPEEKQFQYMFFNIPKTANIEKTTFVVEEDLDTDNPLELANQLEDIFDAYTFSSSKEAITKLRKYLDSVEEKQEELRYQDDIQELTEKLYKRIYKADKIEEYKIN